jgi:hypothetical protein
MTTATVNLGEIAAFWRASRRLYTIYSELKRVFEIDVPLCKDLEYPIDRSEPEVIERVRQWFDQMDSRIQVWQLRQLLQSTNLQTEENLRDLIHRHLDKKQHTDIDRDKIDFLMVQYFAHCAPHGLYEQQITPEEVGRVLQPVLVTMPDKFPEWVGGLDKKLETLNQCDSLEQLQNSGALLEVRELKLALADQHLDPACLIAFTRFNFLARRAFFRAMHLDLHAIRNAINELESRGFNSIDCREAGMTESEGLETIRHLVHQWKTPFRAPYSGGSSFLQLILLRHVLQHALDQSAQQAAPEPPPPAAEPVPADHHEHHEEMAVEPPEPVAAPDEPVVEEAVPLKEHVPEQHVPGPVDEPVQPVAAAPVPPQEPQRARVEDDGYLEQCIADISQQLTVEPPKKGASVTPIMLAGCRLRIAAWEAEAFTSPEVPFHRALERAVAARTILYVCVERHKKGEPTDVFAALEIAHLAAHEMRKDVADAKEQKNIDAAVNLAASAKRLLALIEQAENLLKQ